MVDLVFQRLACLSYRKKLTKWKMMRRSLSSLLLITHYFSTLPLSLALLKLRHGLLPVRDPVRTSQMLRQARRLAFTMSLAMEKKLWNNVLIVLCCWQVLSGIYGFSEMVCFYFVISKNYTCVKRNGWKHGRAAKCKEKTDLSLANKALLIWCDRLWLHIPSEPLP